MTTFTKGQKHDLGNLNLSGRDSSNGSSRKRGKRFRNISSDSARMKEPALPVKLDRQSYAHTIDYKDNLKEKDFDALRVVVAKKKEQRRKILESQEAEKAKA